MFTITTPKAKKCPVGIPKIRMKDVVKQLCHRPYYAGGRLLGTVGTGKYALLVVQQTTSKLTGYTTKRAKRRARNNQPIVAVTTNTLFQHRRHQRYIYSLVQRTELEQRTLFQCTCPRFDTTVWDSNPGSPN